MYEWPVGMDNSVGIDCGSGGWGAVGWEEEGKGAKIKKTITE